MMPDPSSPYALDEQPTSVGRVLLARAFAHWCVLHFGHSAEEVASALDPRGEIGAEVRQQVHFAARLLGELFAAGAIKTWVRPLGGGTPTVLPASTWELDEYRSRFACSALDPARPFDASAAPTHWIFVELEDFNRVVDESCGETSLRSRGAPQAPTQISPPPVHEARAAFEAGAGDRLIRMPEVRRRTGMSSSTLYRRIKEERFPRQVPMESGNIAAWWERDVDDWIANPR